MASICDARSKDEKMEKLPRRGCWFWRLAGPFSWRVPICSQNREALHCLVCFRENSQNLSSLLKMWIWNLFPPRIDNSQMFQDPQNKYNKLYTIVQIAPDYQLVEKCAVIEFWPCPFIDDQALSNVKGYWVMIWIFNLVQYIICSHNQHLHGIPVIYKNNAL
jgi:hypothetical protein